VKTTNEEPVASDLRTEGKLEVNRSGTCLTRGQQVAPKYESRSRPIVLTSDLTQVSNLRTSNENLFRLVQSVFREISFGIKILIVLGMFVLRS